MHDYIGGIIGRYTMYYQIYHIKLALKMKKSVYIMPNSYGPFKNKKNVKMLNKILDKCNFISARESISSNGDTNGLKRNIPLYPDLGFFLKGEEKPKIYKYLEKYGINTQKEKYIAITARPYRFYNTENPKEKYNIYKETFVKIIEYIFSLGYIPLLVVHTMAENDHENDEVCINEIADKLNEKSIRYIVLKDNELTCKDLKTIYGICDAIIGTRFHSVIFSMENGVPAIAITYGGNKGQGIMKDMGLEEYAIKIEEMNYDILKDKFDKLLLNTKEIKQKINDYIKKANIEYQKMIEKIGGK